MARNGGLVLFSALLMGETITSLEAFGYTGLLVCFTLYTMVKAQESKAPKAEMGKDEGPSAVVPLMRDAPKSHPSPDTCLKRELP